MRAIRLDLIHRPTDPNDEIIRGFKGLNIADLLNKSRGEYACVLIDADAQ